MVGVSVVPVLVLALNWIHGFALEEDKRFFGQITGARVKRGASIYPIFGSGGTSQTNVIDNDPSSFIQYLGGSGSSYGQSSGGSSYPNGQTKSSSGYDGTGAGIFDSSHLNSFNLSPYGQGGGSGGSGSPKGASASPGTTGYGNIASFQSVGYGNITPNFANGGSGYSSSSGSSACPGCPASPSTSSDQHTLSANSLLEAAKTSFESQNSVLDVLLSNVNAQPYKGGLLY